MIWLFLSLAFAQDPGVQVVEPGKSITAKTRSYLLPEAYYDSCLVNAQQVETFREAYGQCLIQSEWALEQSRTTFGLAKDQFGTDAQLVEDLTHKVAVLEVGLQTEQIRVKEVKSQRNIAWGITGGLLLGTVAVTVISLAN